MKYPFAEELEARAAACLHPSTYELVVHFTFALVEKLHLAQNKYGYTDNWKTDDWEIECREKMIDHIDKGDPVDVAAYCAFLWGRGWRTAYPTSDSVNECPSCKRMFVDGETCYRRREWPKSAPT